jgi:hypothetical protein
MNDRRLEGASTLARDLPRAAFHKLAEDAISTRPPASRTNVASGPRCATTRGGELLCSFMVQEALGLNDFCPMLARSLDQGGAWREQGPIWPHLQNQYSVFGSISASLQGDLFFYGSRTPIDSPGESNWCEATQGLKVNELVWARSIDDGHSWSDLTPIPMPTPGAAEAPGAMCIARDGTWHACYAPYNCFDPAVIVPRNQVVVVSSRDEGRTWRHAAMMRFADELSTAAEAWVVELADGRLLGTCWNLNQRDGSDYPNAYALSDDGGRTWSGTQSTGILGQATALAPLPDGDALFVYNQRRHGKVGVWLARVRPTAADFGVLSNEIVWEAPPQSSSPDHANWVQFAFGEPSATLLDDGSILVAFWCSEHGVGGIRYVKVKPTSSVS